MARRTLLLLSLCLVLCSIGRPDNWTGTSDFAHDFSVYRESCHDQLLRQMSSQLFDPERKKRVERFRATFLRRAIALGSDHKITVSGEAVATIDDPVRIKVSEF